MDLGGAPVRILLRQSSDQPLDLIGDVRSAASPAGSPTPIQPETGTVPADDRLGFNDDEDVLPARPHAPQRRPEETVQAVQSRPRSLALEHGNLLSQGEDFEGSVGSTAKEDCDHGEDGEDDFRHKLTLVTRRRSSLATENTGNATC